MPAIPLYQQQTQAAGTLSASIDANAVGAGVAQAGARVSGALEDVSQGGMMMRREHAQQVKEQDEKDAKSWAGVAASQAQLDWTQNLQDRKSAALPGAPDFTPGVLNDFDKYAANTVANAPTPLAKQFVQQHMTALRTSLGEQAINFQGAAKVNLRIDNANTTIDNSAKLVQQDPSQYGSALNLIRQTMPDVGPDVQQKLNLNAIQSLTNAAASQVLDTAPYALRDATSKAMGAGGFKGPTGVPWVDDATPEQVKSWNSAAETKIKMMESAAARDLEARNKAAADMINEASDLSLKGGYMSPDYQSKLRAATAGTTYASGAENLINGQAQVSGFATAPASDRNAVLNDLRGRAATQGTDPESAKQVEKMAGVDDAIRKAVIENPWAASQKYGVTADASVVNLAQPQDALKLIQQRAQTQDKVESWTGTAISPLQPQEAAQLSDLLTAMPPPARAAVLGQIGQGLPLGRLQSLADQLDIKDKPQALALKLGSEQTTAGRTLGDLVLRGAQDLKDKTVKKDDTALAGWRADIATMVRGTLGDDRAENDVIDSAFYVRAAMDNQATQIPGYKLTASTEQAVKMVIGQPMERNGTKTILPRGMDEGAFDKALSVYTPEVLKTIAPGGTVFVRGQPVDLQRFSDSLTRYGMKRDGSGNYLPSSGGAFVTLDAAGQQPVRLPVHP